MWALPRSRCCCSPSCRCTPLGLPARCRPSRAHDKELGALAAAATVSSKPPSPLSKQKPASPVTCLALCERKVGRRRNGLFHWVLTRHSGRAQRDPGLTYDNDMGREVVGSTSRSVSTVAAGSVPTGVAQTSESAESLRSPINQKSENFRVVETRGAMILASPFRVTPCH